MRKDIEIIEELQQGINSTANQEELWTRYQNLVYKIARQSNNTSGNDFDDLVQQGFMGLLTAAMKYKPESAGRNGGKASFAVYASPFIRFSMYDYLDATYCQFHIPTYMRTLLGKYRLVCDMLKAEGKEVEPEKVKKKLGINSRQYNRMVRTLHRMRVQSLDAEDDNGDGDDSRSLHELLASGEDLEKYFIVNERTMELHQCLSGALGLLDEKTAEMIKCRYFLGYRLTMIARIMNCSEAYVGSRIERGFSQIRRGEFGFRLAELLDDRAIRKHTVIRELKSESEQPAEKNDGPSMEDTGALFLIG